MGFYFCHRSLLFCFYHVFWLSYNLLKSLNLFFNLEMGFFCFHLSSSRFMCIYVAKKLRVLFVMLVSSVGFILFTTACFVDLLLLPYYLICFGVCECCICFLPTCFCLADMGSDEDKALPPPPPALPPNLVPEVEPIKKNTLLPMARRGTGSKGQRIPLLTNHFKVNFNNANGQFFHYSVMLLVSSSNVFVSF